MLGLHRRQRAESDSHQELIDVDTAPSSSTGARRTGSPRAIKVTRLEPFAVDVRRRNDVAIVQPHGELDLATAPTLRAALDRIEKPKRLVLDLRGLTFIDSSGLHLLMALYQRAQHDGFQLTLVAPAGPADRTIQLTGLGQVLPFVPAFDLVDGEPPSESAPWKRSIVKRSGLTRLEPRN